MLWMVQSCGFFANAHAEGKAVYMKYCSFGFTARLVSDEPNHTLHHKYPYHAFSHPYMLFGLALRLGRRLGVVHSYHCLADTPRAVQEARRLQETYKTMDFKSDFGTPSGGVRRSSGTPSRWPSSCSRRTLPSGPPPSRGTSCTPGSPPSRWLPGRGAGESEDGGRIRTWCETAHLLRAGCLLNY